MSSKFIDSQSRRLCAEVNKYARKLGYIEKDETVEVETSDTSPEEMEHARFLTFSVGNRNVSTQIAEVYAHFPEAKYLIWACGLPINKMVRDVAKMIVHDIFDPEE